MRKLSLFLAIIMLVGTLLVSCAEKEEFVKVAYVTYTVDGKKVTEQSKAYIGIGEREEITYEQYYDGTLSKYRMDDKSLSIILSPDQKEVDEIQGLNDSDKGEYLYFFESVGFHEYIYYRAKISGLYYSYISVNEVDDDTIIISNSSGQTTYNVSSYSIKEFN